MDSCSPYRFVRPGAKRLTWCVALLLFLLSTHTLSAKDMRGKLGIGAKTSLTGAQGISLRYWPKRYFGMEFLAGINVVRRDSGNDQVGLAFGVQAMYVLREIGPANFMLGVRGVLAYLSDENQTGLEQITAGGDKLLGRIDSGPQSPPSYFHLALEVPLIAEFHMSDAFSFQMAAGFMMTFIPEQGKLLDPDPAVISSNDEAGTYYGFGPGNLFGSFGFTYYF